MSKVKVSELSGKPLDWMVAVAMGLKPEKKYTGIYARGWPHTGCRECPDRIQPSTSWTQAGPIIERECIDLLCLAGGDDGWQADKYLHTEKVEGFGPTPLIAAMRCFVASKLGDEVEVPDELLGGH